MTEQTPLLFGLFTQEAVVLFASAVAAALLGWTTVWSQRDIARTRLTFETLDRKNWDGDFIEKRLAFGKLRRAGQMATYAAAPKVEGADPNDLPKDYLDSVSTIPTILNDYEGLAIGIRRGILDEEFLFRYHALGSHPRLGSCQPLCNSTTRSISYSTNLCRV